MSSDQRPFGLSLGLPSVMAAALLILLGSGLAAAQSNYVQHGDSGNYTTNGLPEEATLDGKVRAGSALLEGIPDRLLSLER